MSKENEECENCPHKGQCDLQCYELSVWYVPADTPYDEE